MNITSNKKIFSILIMFLILFYTGISSGQSTGLQVGDSFTYTVKDVKISEIVNGTEYAPDISSNISTGMSFTVTVDQIQNSTPTGGLFTPISGGKLINYTMALGDENTTGSAVTESWVSYIFASLFIVAFSYGFSNPLFSDFSEPEEDEDYENDSINTVDDFPIFASGNRTFYNEINEQINNQTSSISEEGSETETTGLFNFNYETETLSADAKSNITDNLFTLEMSFSGIKSNATDLGTWLNSNNYGIYLYYYSNYNILTQNTAKSNSKDGIYLYTSNNNTLYQNIIYNNSDYSIIINEYSNNNTIYRNRIINNNLVGSQALDNGTDNKFYSNYWNDWTSPDIDGDSIVDIPYNIDGVSNNQDLFPQILTSNLALTLNNPENGTINQSGTIIDLSITGSMGTLIYKWDSNSNQSVSDNYNPTLPVGDGVHVLYIYIQDDIGNWNSTIFSFTTDDTAPIITLNSPIDGAIYQSGTIIDLSIIGSNGTLIYNWDNNVNSTVSDTFNPILPSGDGGHVLNLYARDVAGNWVYKQYTFTTDDSPPTISLVSPTNSSTLTSGTILDFEVTNSNGTMFYSWDGSANQSILSSFDISLVVGDGLHTLDLYTEDSAGNWQQAYFEFITDDTPPMISLVSPSNGTTLLSGTTLDFEVTGSNGTLFYSWDGSANQSVLSPFDLSLIIGDGLHTLGLYTVDGTGNWQRAYFEFTTDDTPPTISLVSPSNGTSLLSGTTLDFTVIGSNGTLFYSWDGSANQSVLSPFDLSLIVGDGLHTLDLYAVDGVGNWQQAYFEFTTDDTPPMISLVSPSNGSTLISGVNLDFTVTGSNGTLFYSWDGSANQSVLSPFNISLILGDGLHTLDLYAEDGTGNWQRAYFEFTTDDTPPTISLVSPSNGTTLLSGTTLDFEVTGSNGTLFYSWDGSANQSVLAPFDISLIVGDGLHTLDLYAEDASGNWHRIYFEFTTDDSSPSSSSPSSSSPSSSSPSSSSPSSSSPSSSSPASTTTPKATTPGFTISQLLLMFSIVGIVIFKRRRK